MVPGWVTRGAIRAARGWAPYVAFAATLSLLAGLFGAAIGVESGQIPLAPFEVREPGDSVQSLSAVGLFVHNSRIALWMIGSALLFGIPTLYMQLYNGLLLGSVTAIAAGKLGPLQTLLLLAPHGVVEIPSIWLAGGVGFRIAHVYWKLASSDRDRIGVPRLLGESSLLLLLVLCALALAAAIEAHVTTTLA